MLFMKKTRKCKSMLLLSTALTAAVFLDVSTTRAAEVNGIESFPAGGISNDDVYKMNGGSASGDNPTASIIDETLSEVYDDEYGSYKTDESVSYVGGYYSLNNDDIDIEARSGTPRFDFNGGVIWDVSGYVAFGTFSPGLPGLEYSYSPNNTPSNINISGGIFTGKIDIRKGASVYEFITKTVDGDSIKRAVNSYGNVNIYSGNFYASNESQIKMYRSNSGSINISGGNFFVGYRPNFLGTGITEIPLFDSGSMTVLAENEGQSINVTGGVFKINADYTLALHGYSGTLDASSSNYGFSGNGTLALSSTEGFTIASAITWDSGTIRQLGGPLTIAAPVQIGAFKQDGGTLQISSVLSIENNIKMNGNLTGKGELILSESANAEFGLLRDFGTISLRRGSVTFATGGSNFTTLNGAQGTTADEKIGVIRINSQTTIDQVNLKNSTMILSGELIVKAFDSGDGEVIFWNKDGNTYSLTLTEDSTIWNTSKIHTDGPHTWSYWVEEDDEDKEVTEEALPGTLTIKDGMTLTFADQAGEDDEFVSNRLTVKVENGASALFNSDSVTFATLQMTNGTAQIQSGTVNVNKISFGNLINAGTLTVDSGANLNVITSLTANKGATVNINGTLNVASLTTEGDKDAMGILTGSGTLKITKNATFNGRIDNLANMVVDGTGVTTNKVYNESTGVLEPINGALITFDNQTGIRDTVGAMTVKNGTVNLENGTMLQLASLSLDHGTINLNGQNVILALTKNPATDDAVSGEGNSISGAGRLELLNDVSMSFGGAEGQGAVKYLGGLIVNEGTATITASTTLGSFLFNSPRGGTLQIENGATLTLADEGGTTCSRTDNCRIMTNAGNVVTGEGTLDLVDGDGSVFGGKVELGALILGASGGSIAFNFSGDSRIGTFTVNNAGANVTVDNGTLSVGNDFGYANTTVSGTGTLYLETSGTFKTGSGSLANLKIGTEKVTTEGTFGKIFFADDSEGELTLSGTTTVTGDITVGPGNRVVESESTLVLSGATGNFSSDLSGLSTLTVQNGATANIYATTSVGSTLNLQNNATLVIGSGAILTVNNNLGTDETSVITGDGTLNLDGPMTVNGILKDLNNLTIASGVVTTTKKSTIKNDVTVNAGAELTLQDSEIKGNVDVGDSVTLTSNGNAVIKGNVTAGENANLSFAGDTAIQGNVTTSNNATLTFSKESTIGGTLDIAYGATVNFNGGSINETLIGGTLNINDDTLLPTVSFDVNGGTLDIAAGKTVTVTNNITLKSGDKLNGTGTLYLGGESSGYFGMNKAFEGTIKIGTGTAYIQTNAKIEAIGFAGSSGGVLNIADGKELKVGSIVTAGSNKISGNGTLNLTGSGSKFQAPIGNLGILKVSGGTAEFYNNINIGTLAFYGGGSVELKSGVTMTVTDMTQDGGGGAVFGEGSFVAGSGTIAISTNNKRLASATIGTGIMNFIGNSVIGSLKYSSVYGTIVINDNVTVSVGSDFSGIGKLEGAESARLQLEGQAGATFSDAQTFKGIISAGSGYLRFLSDTDLTSLILASADAKFERYAEIDSVQIDNGSVEFNQTAMLGTLSITGAGTARFKKNATLNDDGTIAANGTLDIDVNTLTFDGGDFDFKDNSRLSLRISRGATDDQGNVHSTGYGKLVFNGGTLGIQNNVNLNVIIDYGVKTAETGSVFQFVEGSKTGSFKIENNRYSLIEEACGSSGICYRISETSSGGEVAEKEQGNQNQIDTAGAFLDGELFEYGTKIFDVAEHLDALSQKSSTSKAYLNALTALAPDITGAMTRQPIALQSKISNTLSGRLNGLMGSMGSSSKTYRDIQKMYGRSGGSPYRSRFMRPDDYYRRAGYYDQDDQPVTRQRPAYRRRVEADSQEAFEATSERKRWAKRKPSYKQPKEFGLWAQAFYNTADYLSASKPDGFSGDTNGFAFGADMQLFDVFALGLGYASTTSTVDSLQRSTDVSGDSIFLYGMYKPSDWFVSAVLNTTSMSYEETKDISGITVGDNYDGSSFGASVMIGKDLKTWTPAVGIRYVTADRDAHKDEIGQDISSVSTNVMTFVAEGRFNRDFAKTNNSLWHSELSGALTYDFTSANEDAVVNLPNGSIYTVKGDDFDPMGVELGASIAYIWGDHVDISAGYNLEWRPDYMSHSLTAMFRYSF